jgi:O-antigen ligase
MAMALITWCNRLIKIGFYVAFGIVPLLLTPWNYELFEYNKMMAVYAITAIVATAWLVKMIKEQQIRITKTPLDIPILLFVASQLISAMFSIDPHVSWFGYYSRFNGGMFSILSYTLLYYAFVSNSELFLSTDKAYSIQAATDTSSKKKDKKSRLVHPLVSHNIDGVTRLLSLSLITATVVAAYGVLERLGIDKHLWVQDVQNRVFATLGQPNWLAAYLVALIPLAMALGLRNIGKPTEKKNLTRAMTLLLPVLFFVVLLFTRSRSGLLGFAVADIVFWALLITPNFLRHPSLAKQNTYLEHRSNIRIATVLHALFALIVFINGTGTPAVDKWVTFAGLKTTITNVTNTTKTQEATPSAMAGPALEVGGTESGTIRKYVWQGAINAWNSSLKTKLIGTGTETFAFAFYEFRPAAHNNTSEWDFLYNKAHNEYLNYLATTGVLGLGSYLLLIGSVIWLFITRIKKLLMENRKDGDASMNITLTVHSALFAGWLSLLVTNFFGFSVVILQVFLFLFPAIAIVLTSHNEPPKANIIDLKPPAWVMWVILLLGIYTLARIGSYWYADTLYANGYRLIRAGLYGQAIPALNSAIALNQREPIYHDELANGYATLSVAAFESNNATQAAQLASLATEESMKALAISPRNVNFYKTRTKVYYTLSSLDPSFNAKAVEALEMALTLSPNDPKIYYNLAILVGRDGDITGAISYLLKAKELKPNYRDVYYALWVFYTEEKKPADARAILEEYLTKVDPNDTDFQERLK